MIYVGLINCSKLTLRISGVMEFGPLDEKAAITGAGLTPITALGGVIRPCGLLKSRPMFQ